MKYANRIHATTHTKTTLPGSMDSCGLGAIKISLFFSNIPFEQREETLISPVNAGNPARSAVIHYGIQQPDAIDTPYGRNIRSISATPQESHAAAMG